MMLIGKRAGVVAGSRSTPTTDQTLSTATSTTVAFGTNDYNDGGFWSSGANTRMTAPSSGYYAMSAALRTKQTSGNFQVWFQVNGSGVYHAMSIHDIATTGTTLSITLTLKLSAGDYVEVVAYQTSGGNADLQGNRSSFEFLRIG